MWRGELSTPHPIREKPKANCQFCSKYFSKEHLWSGEPKGQCIYVHLYLYSTARVRYSTIRHRATVSLFKVTAVFGWATRYDRIITVFHCVGLDRRRMIDWAPVHKSDSSLPHFQRAQKLCASNYINIISVVMGVRENRIEEYAEGVVSP